MNKYPYKINTKLLKKVFIVLLFALILIQSNESFLLSDLGFLHQLPGHLEIGSLVRPGADHGVLLPTGDIPREAAPHPVHDGAEAPAVPGDGGVLHIRLVNMPTGVYINRY